VLQIVRTGRRSSSVATTRTATVAGRSSLKRINARSRKPSPFGLTVASHGVSPAKGVPPFEMRSPSSRGGPVSAGAAATAPTAIPAASPAIAKRLRIPYNPLIPNSPRPPILSSR
jgi:hypothetical protein